MSDKDQLTPETALVESPEHTANLYTYMSNDISKLAEALSKFQWTVEAPEKDSTVKVKTSTGGSYEFSYATLDSITKTIKKPLAESGLATFSIIRGENFVTKLVHTSGQWIESTLKLADLTNGKKGAQELGSAITYARRYLLCSILGVVADEDDDGNKASGNEVQDKTAKTADAKPWFNQEQFDNFITALAEWKVVVKDLDEALVEIKKKYNISGKAKNCVDNYLKTGEIAWK